ncbi:MAG: tetratricopeptide repeat protein [Candidatus Omnitrophota bacterium]
MAELFWKKCGYLSGMLALGILLGMIVFLCNAEIGDFDLWLHLKTGEVIVEQGFIPTHDIFSCTVKGQPWNNHEWLFQAIFYLFLSCGGYEGLFTAQAIIVALTFMTLLFLSDLRRRHYFTVFLLFILTLVFQTRLTMRPDLFSFFFFSFYLYILSVHLEKKASVWLLFAVQILWVNMHGFFIFGPFLILLSMISELIKRYLPLPWKWNDTGRLSNQEFQRLGFAFVATSLACLVNPQYVKGALYPFAVLFQMAGESSIFFSHIQELQKPITFATLFTQRYIHFKVLILVSFYSFIVNRKHVDISALFLWLVFLLFSLQAIRNMIFFGIVAYLVTILNFSEYRFEDILPVKFKRKLLKLMTIVFLNVFMLLWILHFADSQSKRVSFDFEKYEMKSSFEGISQRSYPWAATTFLKENHIQGNFFNDFNSGAFLVGRCFPAVRVFIDGRTELYGPQFFKRYKKILDEGNRDAFLKTVEEYQLTGVFLGSSYNRVSDKLLRELSQDKGWVLVYLDYDAVIFLRNVEENKMIIEAFRKDKKKIIFKDFDFERLGPRGVFPYREIKRAYNLEALGFDDLALEQVQDALLISPGSSEPYYIRGMILRKRGEGKEAFKDFRIATMISPNDVDMRYSLALAYFELGNYKKAIKEYETVLRSEQKRSEIFFSCAQAYLEDEQYGKALEACRKAFLLKPKNIVEPVKIAQDFIKKKKYDEAFTIYAMILRASPKEAEIYYEIGICFQDLKESEKAKEAFARGLRIDPSSQTLRRAMEGLNKSIKK